MKIETPNVIKYPEVLMLIHKQQVPTEQLHRTEKNKPKMLISTKCSANTLKAKIPMKRTEYQYLETMVHRSRTIFTHS